MNEVVAAGLAGTIDYADANTYGGCFGPRFNRLTPDCRSVPRPATRGDRRSTRTPRLDCQGCAPPMNCATRADLPQARLRVGWQLPDARRDALRVGRRSARPVLVPVAVLPEPRRPTPRRSRRAPTLRATLFDDDAGFDPASQSVASRVSTRFVIIGGGPAGNTAATYAARLGAEVTMIERDVVGGAAHLWDCIPSKSMIATGRAISLTRRDRWAWAWPTSTRPSTSRASPAASCRSSTRCADNTTQLLDEPGGAADQRAPRGSPARTRSRSTGPTASRRSSSTPRSCRPGRGRGSPTGASPTATAS